MWGDIPAGRAVSVGGTGKGPGETLCLGRQSRPGVEEHQGVWAGEGVNGFEC